MLIRHGQPDFDTHRWVGSHELRSALQHYREVHVSTAPVKELFTPEFRASAYCMTSRLARAQDSADLCRFTEPEVSELLNEAELPHPDKLVCTVPWSLLVPVCRMAWLLGYQNNAAGISHDRARALQAARLLNDRASEHVAVVVFGHGIMNRLIARELTKLGWIVKSKTGRGYWSMMTLQIT